MVSEIESGVSGPDPEKAAAIGRAADDLAAHVQARAAQHPDLAPDFVELAKVVNSLKKRFVEPELGEARQLGSVSETEARLVEGLVKRLTRGRDHKELFYLVELAENLALAVATASIV